MSRSSVLALGTVTDEHLPVLSPADATAQQIFDCELKEDEAPNEAPERRLCMHRLSSKGRMFGNVRSGVKESSSTAPFDLLGLPAEIRNKIYGLVLIVHGVWVWPRHDVQERITQFWLWAKENSRYRHLEKDNVANLLRVNRQIRLEASPIFYSENEFGVVLADPPYVQLCDWIEQIGERNASYVRNILICNRTPYKLSRRGENYFKAYNRVQSALGIHIPRRLPHHAWEPINDRADPRSKPPVELRHTTEFSHLMYRLKSIDHLDMRILVQHYSPIYLDEDFKLKVRMMWKLYHAKAFVKDSRSAFEEWAKASREGGLGFAGGLCCYDA